MVFVGVENVRVHYSALVSPQSLVKCDWVYFVGLAKASLSQVYRERLCLTLQRLPLILLQWMFLEAIAKLLFLENFERQWLATLTRLRPLVITCEQMLLAALEMFPQS